MLEVIGFGEAARLFKDCGEETNWDVLMEELVLELVKESGFEAELGLVEADVIMEFFLRDFHLILAVRNGDKKPLRFCYVLEFDLLYRMTLSTLSSLIATSAVSLIVSHYFDNRDTGFMASHGVRIAKEKFPEAVIET